MEDRDNLLIMSPFLSAYALEDIIWRESSTIFLGLYSLQFMRVVY